MARLTNKQRAELRACLAHEERAHAYLMSEQTVIATRRGQATTTLDYERPDGSAIAEVDKHIGSDITGLAQSIRGLARFITHN